jgi:predicted RNA-binding protein associated with RNAse of E/G family
MKTIMIKSRAGEIEGKRNKEIAYFDNFDKRADKIIRHFILFQYGVMLRFEPFGWKNEWYIDFIEIEVQPNDSLVLRDVYLDMVVEGMGPTYRIVDADELAEAFGKGHISSEQMCRILKNLQTFVDDHLHRDINNFPPKSVLPFFLVQK